MLRLLRAHVRHNVIGYIALFFAMTGTASAAAAMWTGENIKDGTLTGADIADGSLTASDMAASSGGSAPLLTFDSGTTTWNGQAFAPSSNSYSYEETPLTSVTFTTAKSGFAQVFYAGNASATAGASCPTSVDPASVSGAVYLDGVYAGGFASNGGNQPPSTNYLTAGDHTLELRVVRGTCSGTQSGSYTVKDVHLLVTTP